MPGFRFNIREGVMFDRASRIALIAAFVAGPAAPALAVNEILITHVKALAGNVTPGDAAGYPVTLSTAGSYELASNLQAPAGVGGIAVGSPEISIDLKGYRLHGGGVATSGIYGVTNNVTIRNGTATAFVYDGIAGTGDNWIVEGVRSVDNGRFGILVDDFALVSRNVVTGNDGNGIDVGNRSLVEDNIASGNDGAGIAIGNGTVLGNTIIGNGGLGIEAGSAATGYGNNTLSGNNAGGVNVNPFPGQMHPNRCLPACP